MKYNVYLKPGVRIKKINWGTTLFFDVLLELAAHIGMDMVITSMDDGLHRTESDHYKGLAGDIRARHLTVEQTCELMTYLTRYDMFSIYDNHCFPLVQFEWKFRMNKDAQWVRAKTNVYKPEWQKVIEEYKNCKYHKVCHIHIEWEEE